MEPAPSIAPLLPGDLCAHVRDISDACADAAVWIAITAPDDHDCARRMYIAVHPAHRWHGKGLLMPDGVIDADAYRSLCAASATVMNSAT